eukprot:PITA_05757
MNKSEDVDACLLGLKKFFILNSYTENMKENIATFNLKGKEDIWWEDVKNFKGIQMGSMIDDEYTNRFLELLRYVPYLKEEKAKVQIFISGLPVAYRDWIEFDEPRLLEEVIRMLKHCYKQSKRKVEHKHELKGNGKVKVKWPPKWGRPQDAGEKDNVVSYKNFNKIEKAHGEQQTRGDGRAPLQCSICGKDHCKRLCP